MGMEDYFGGNNTHLHIKDVFLKYIDYLYASTRLQLLCIHMYIYVCMCLYILLADQDESERTKGKDKSLCKDCIIALVRTFSTMLKSG